MDTLTLIRDRHHADPSDEALALAYADALDEAGESSDRLRERVARQTAIRSRMAAIDVAAIEKTHPHAAEHVRAILGHLPAITAWGGILRRVAPGVYEWSDGTPEPRVREGRIHAHNFRCTSGSPQYVQVPVSAARRRGNEEIRWCAEGADLGWYQIPTHTTLGDRAGLIYVPLEEWDAHADALPCSVEWDRADEAAILAKAESLGAVVPTDRRAFTA